MCDHTRARLFFFQSWQDRCDHNDMHDRSLVLTTMCRRNIEHWYTQPVLVPEPCPLHPCPKRAFNINTDGVRELHRWTAGQQQLDIRLQFDAPARQAVDKSWQQLRSEVLEWCSTILTPSRSSCSPDQPRGDDSDSGWKHVKFLTSSSLLVARPQVRNAPEGGGDDLHKVGEARGLDHADNSFPLDAGAAHEEQSGGQDPPSRSWRIVVTWRSLCQQFSLASEFESDELMPIDQWRRLLGLREPERLHSSQTSSEAAR